MQGQSRVSASWGFMGMGTVFTPNLVPQVSGHSSKECWEETLAQAAHTQRNGDIESIFYT